MYRMLSPAAEAPDTHMGIATPQGTGGRSPPPPPVGTRQVGPPEAAMLGLASTGSGVEVGVAPRTNG
eukprot:4172334-Amphidinium_carterae.1